MFIKKLTISTPVEIIRKIDFHTGLNLIIDNTSVENSKLTGNNVGKTTVLKLIDFCLGAKGKIIYTDIENKKANYDIVKEFLVNNEIIICLVLSENINDSSAKEIEIQRNFLSRKKAIRKINGINYSEGEFIEKLQQYIMPDKTVKKPTFRQVISHNIRYKDDNINNTLKTLDKFTKDDEYESLYLYLLGCTFNDGEQKQKLIARINQEEIFKSRLEKKQTKMTYEIALELLNDEIDVLNQRKVSFNLNESLENDLEQLNNVKFNINRVSSQISSCEIRKNLIEESKRDLEQSLSNIDLLQLRTLYEEASKYVSNIQKTFEDLVEYHNHMVVEKIKYISNDLPKLNERIVSLQNELSLLLGQEKELTSRIAKRDSIEELEEIISMLNEKYKLKGEYETIISQIKEVEDNIDKLKAQIKIIDDYLFSHDFEKILKEQVNKFNKLFSSISQELYGEKYALTFNCETINKNQKCYKFSAFNANMSSGKKQGEILCFDLAYLLFADEENIPCLHFLLNDKKELMHDNQLIKVADFVQDKNIQLVVSILKDKLPESVLKKAHVVVELSQEDKLFRIEKD